MTVEELRRALAGMPGDAVVMVRIQGVSLPLEGAFIETQARPSADAMRKLRTGTGEPDEEVEIEHRHRLILSNHRYH